MKNKKDIRRIASVFAISGALLLFSVILGIAFGSVRLSFTEVISGLFGSGESTQKIIVSSLRLPRVLGAALAGASLAVAGLVLQCVTGNSLCAPNIVGINSGAGFAVMLVLCFAPSLYAFLPLGAFLGALAATLTISAIARLASRRSVTLVLAGVAVSSILNAAISFLSLRFPDMLPSYTAFSVGGFSGTELDSLVFPFIIILCCFAACQLLSQKLNLLSLGDDVAASLGVNVGLLRTLTLILASAICGAAVSFAGLLGFVGLIVPHAVRRLVGNDMRINLSLSAILGAMLVILSDLCGRTLFSPSELPAGIITALIGAPFFLYLLCRRRGGIDKA